MRPEHLSSLSSETCEAYKIGGYAYGFDKEDGHLAFVFQLGSGRYLYVCPHVRRGAQLKGVKLDVEGLP